MADEDITLNEDQLLEDVNGEAELLNEVRKQVSLKWKSRKFTPKIVQDDANMVIDPELEAIKARVKEMEEEAEKIKQMQSEVDKQMAGSAAGAATVPLTAEEKAEIDSRSVYVGNVDYGASAEELEAHFHGCGTINRVTILCNKADGHPKGFAYIEFGAKEFVETALGMNETLFRGRQIKVSCFFFVMISMVSWEHVFLFPRLCRKGLIVQAFPRQIASREVVTVVELRLGEWWEEAPAVTPHTVEEEQCNVLLFVFGSFSFKERSLPNKILYFLINLNFIKKLTNTLL